MGFPLTKGGWPMTTNELTWAEMRQAIAHYVESALTNPRPQAVEAAKRNKVDLVDMVLDDIVHALHNVPGAYNIALARNTLSAIRSSQWDDALRRWKLIPTPYEPQPIVGERLMDPEEDPS